MRQTGVADLHRLQVSDLVLVSAAKEGDLDTVLGCLEGLQSSKDEEDRRVADNTAYLIPLIKAWQKQLG
jgi:hypothetical protein